MAATPTVSVGIRRPFGSLAADPGQVQGRLRAGLRPHEPRAVGERGGGVIVIGCIEPIVKELPMEYAVEINCLIQLQMEGAVGWT